MDCSKTFALIPAAESMKITVAVANEKDWSLRDLAMKQAFIQANSDEAAYMRLPAGCGYKNGEVVVLKVATYGLQQQYDGVILWGRVRLTRVCSVK